MIRTTFLTATAVVGLAGAAFADAHMKNIVETAQEAGNFSTLLAAAEAAGLVETLTGEGPYTVFAPTDEAFAALPEGTLDTLLMEENQQQLTDILLYHVVPGAVMSGDLTNEMEAETALEGQTVTIMTEPEVSVEGANVVTADIEASNGVIHVIDSVILPPES